MESTQVSISSWLDTENVVGASAVGQWVNRLRAVLASKKGASLSPSCCTSDPTSCCYIWESSEGWPTYLGIAPMRDTEESHSSWLQPDPVWILWPFEEATTHKKFCILLYVILTFKYKQTYFFKNVICMNVYIHIYTYMYMYSTEYYWAIKNLIKSWFMQQNCAIRNHRLVKKVRSKKTNYHKFSLI